ncbi:MULTISPECIES: hypothetical protein [unclassified Rathayibacter]|uniref:hypothetical protein n=1 Tax=unclassified Rathayibacter TaxID=2609250 RepID=UPI001053B6BE|nr:MULTISPECIES: hypothetical protein [unclassified Rathayibacter]TCL84813.1 hypothetical protein EDF49_102486 [Rathayibacter sp. PhB192]TCM30531.1 hypothetical protein EDF43_102486 [Rathayibacter sp. PhB179]
MQTRVITPYVRELVRQYRFADLASHDYNSALRLALTPDGPHDSDESLRIYQSLQNMLTAAAQISKLFWPTIDPDAVAERRLFVKARSKTLRTLAQVGNGSLLETRRVRNSIEHFDERLDSVMIDPPNAVIDSYIGRLNAIVIENSTRVNLRSYDPYSGDLSLLDDSVPIRDLFLEICRVGHNAEMWLEAHPWPSDH